MLGLHPYFDIRQIFRVCNRLIGPHEWRMQTERRGLS